MSIWRYSFDSDYLRKLDIEGLLRKKELALMADTPRKVRCAGCYHEVAETHAHLTTIGLLCPRCFGLK